MAHAMMAAAFEHIDETFEVRLHIGLRIGERIAHARLRGQMEHQREAVLIEQRVHARRVGEIEFGEGKTRPLGKLLQPRLLQFDAVIVGEVV